MSRAVAARRQRNRRARIAQGAIVAALLACAAVALTTGSFDVPLVDVPAALIGIGDEGAVRVIEQLRLPRLLVALVTGAAFGMAGALFQGVTHNALASPDVVGFTQGAAMAAVLCIVLVDAPGPGAIALASLAGGIVAALLVLGIARRPGAVGGDRIVLVGIGVGALLAAVTAWLLATAELARAQGAAVWITGSLNGRSWEQLVPVAIALAVLALPTALLARNVGILELGDERAAALGVAPVATRVLAIGVAVALAAAATAAVGPIPFVALAAPHVARRLTRRPAPELASSALVGALLLLASDLVAQRIAPAGPLPAGVITGAAGGVFLAWLLAHDWKDQLR